jgi:hypothetical protein
MFCEKTQIFCLCFMPVKKVVINIS